MSARGAVQQRIAVGERISAWTEEFALSNDEANRISDPTYIEPGLVVQGHVVVFVGKPNAGKSTILFHLACRWAAAGAYTVIYVDADTNPSDAKRKLKLAQQHGLKYLTPDLKVGKSMSDVVKQLERLGASDVDLTGQVVILDTLKKMCNVIQKDSLKHILNLLRKLSARGMTCIVLGHTNKYKSDSGEYVYEGTGDLESDVDELVYLEPRQNHDKSLTVSTRCTKKRADIGEFTWDLSADRSVTRREHYVDIAAEERRHEQLEKDETVIELIYEALSSGPKKQHEIVTRCRASSVGAKAARAVLKRYSGRHWLKSKLPENNALEYRLIPSRAPACQTG